MRPAYYTRGHGVIFAEGHFVLAERVFREAVSNVANIWLHADMKLSQERVAKGRKHYTKPEGASTATIWTLL